MITLIGGQWWCDAPGTTVAPPRKDERFPRGIAAWLKKAPALRRVIRGETLLGDVVFRADRIDSAWPPTKQVTITWKDGATELEVRRYLKALDEEFDK